MTKACHTSMQTGARVIAWMRDGSHVIGKFKERKGRFVVLDVARIDVKDLRQLGYYKGQVAAPPDPQ